MSATFLFEFVGNTLITVHGQRPPTDHEWTEYLEAGRRFLAERPTGKALGCIVFTDGGGPNSRQRAELASYREFVHFPTAVVSDSVVVRGIVTAISWFGKDIRAFAPTALTDAFEYVGVPAQSRAACMATVARLRAKLLDVPLESMKAGQSESELLIYLATERLSNVKDRLKARQSNR